MRDGRFVLNFLGQKTRNDVDIAHFQPYFLDYTPEKWDVDVNGGAFKFTDIEGISYNCLIVHSRAHGICLMFDVWDKTFRSGKSTVGDMERLQETVDVGSDEIYPVGCFIPPQDAWPLVEQYLRNPTEYPNSRFLKDVNEIQWPEVY